MSQRRSSPRYLLIGGALSLIYTVWKDMKPVAVEMGLRNSNLTNEQKMQLLMTPANAELEMIRALKQHNCKPEDIIIQAKAIKSTIKLLTKCVEFTDMLHVAKFMLPGFHDTLEQDKQKFYKAFEDVRFPDKLDHSEFPDRVEYSELSKPVVKQHPERASTITSEDEVELIAELINNNQLKEAMSYLQKRRFNFKTFSSTILFGKLEQIVDPGNWQVFTRMLEIGNE